MNKASEYRAHAEECRRLAQQMDLPDQREQLLSMAERWDWLARDRAQWVERHPDAAQPESRRD